MKQNKRLTDYWYAHYVNHGLCSLCGNAGQIDTRATAISAAGIRSGRVNFCICPNGQAMRQVTESKHRRGNENLRVHSY